MKNSYYAISGGRADGVVLCWRVFFLVGVFFFGSFFVTQNALAATLRVPEDYSTIQSAINSATTGDQVLVNNGTYYENLIIDGRDKTITIKSVNGPENTIIDGSKTTDPKKGSVIVLTLVREEFLLEGFTLIGGTGTLFFYFWDGGAIFSEGSYGQIVNCRLCPETGGTHDAHETVRSLMMIDTWGWSSPRAARSILS